MSEKKFKCSLCDYSSNRKYNVEKVHMKKHTETTVQHKFECTACGLTFRCKSNLRVHCLSARHIKRLKTQLPEACIVKEDKYNDITIKTRTRIDPKKSSLYLKKVDVKKNKKKDQEEKKEEKKIATICKAEFVDYNYLEISEMQSLVQRFLAFCKNKIDLNDFYDFDYYQENDEIENHYIDICNTLQDEDFTLLK